MTVFRGYMKIIQRNMGYVFLYTGIFFGIILILESVVGKQTEEQYQASALNIAVIDEAQDELSNGIIQALSQKHHVITDMTDKRELAESMYYEKLDYVVQIPENAEQVLLEDGGSLKITKNPGDYSGIYADMEINTFLQTVQTYHKSGMEMKRAVERALEIIKINADVTVQATSKRADGSQGYFFYFRYLPYVFLYTLCYVVPIVLRNFNEKDMERRINSSGVSSFRQGIQGMLAMTILSGGLWALLNVLCLIIYGKKIILDSHMGFYIVNSTCLMLVSIAIAYLLGNLLKNTSAINGVANTIALGMSFLCGVFVDLDVLSPGIIFIAKFLPVYWYEKANILLYEYGNLTTAQFRTVLMSFGIQIAVALAIFSATMIIKRIRVNQE